MTEIQIKLDDFGCLKKYHFKADKTFDAVNDYIMGCRRNIPTLIVVDIFSRSREICHNINSTIRHYGIMDFSMALKKNIKTGKYLTV